MRADRGDHTGEVDAQLRLTGVARVTAHCHQHVGEVQAGRGDRDLDLARPGRGALERGQFQGLQIARCTDLHPHTVEGVIHDGGVALFGPKRSREQVRRVPPLIAECGLVLIRTEQHLMGNERALGLLVNIDLGRVQSRVLSPDHPQQATQSGLLEIGALAREYRLRTAGDDVEPRGLAGSLRQIANDPDQIANVVTATLSQLIRSTTGARGGHHDHIPETAFGKIALQPFGIGGVVGMLRPGHRRHVRIIELERVGELRGQDVRGVRHADQQPGSGIEMRGKSREFLLAPLDGHQPLVEHAVTIGGSGAHGQTLDREQNRAVLIDEIEVRLDAGTVQGDDPGQAVPRLVGRPVGAQTTHAQRKKQPAGTGVLHAGMSGDRLEAGIKQSGVHTVGAVLTADRAGQSDLGQHRLGAVLAGIDSGQRREGGTELHTAGIEPEPHLGAVGAIRVGREQCVHVVVVGAVITVDRLQHRAGATLTLTVLVSLDLEFQCAGHFHTCLDADGGLVLQQQHALEPDVADLRTIPECGTGGGQRHLAEGSTWHRGHIVDLVIDQPRQSRGADLAGPHVTLRLVEQAHMRTQQWMSRHKVRSAPLIGGLAFQDEWAMAPRRQRGVNQLTFWCQHREIDAGTGCEQVTHQSPKPVWRLLAATHSGDRRHRDIQRGRGLVDGANQQRVR